ncbi:MAG: hypothetical protein ACREMW_07645 [Gemmatimonadales bacterium]
MRRALVVPVVLLSLNACHVGPSAENFAPAIGPNGIWADLRLKGVRVEGELLEARDSGLLVLRKQRVRAGQRPPRVVTFVPLEAIRRGRFERYGTLIVNGAPVAKGALQRLRLVSRFPNGLTPELRAALLTVHGQTEPDVARP